ncbi:Protein CHUP1, chloroplastic [Quillaja saponaria]|nr:Protein CHUP1, chloroplastic [Quillaja saponaria]
MARKSLSKAALSETQVNLSESNFHEGWKREESLHSLASTCIPSDIIDEPTILDTNSLAESSRIHDEPIFEEEIVGLRSRIDDLQMRELELQLQFNRYCDLREQQFVLVELRNIFSLETAHAEFLDREISSMEAEITRLDNLGIQYLKILEHLEHWKSENCLLQRKLKKLLKKMKAQSRIIKEQSLRIEAREAEILRNHDALETRISVTKKLEEEIRELHTVLDQMQVEKNELLEKLDLAERSSASKVEAENICKEEYNQLINELEQLQKERTAEVKELIYLRWSNTCLKHELMRNHQQQQRQRHNQEGNSLELDFEGSGRIIHYDSEHETDDCLVEHNVPCFGAAHSDHDYSKRKKLLQRLRRWVEGGDKAKGKLAEKEKH